MCYHMIRIVVFVVLGGTLLRLTAGAVVLIPKCTTLQNVPWLCACIPEESYAISLWSSTATSAVNSSGGVTASEAANSLSAAAGPELSTTMESYRQSSFGFGHSRTRLGSGLCAVAPRCLSTENAGRTMTVLRHALCGDQSVK